EDEPKPTPAERRKTLMKIGVIISVTIVTILAVASFLPIAAFSQKEEVQPFSVIQGEENIYSQKPLVPKDGYIYAVPEGTYIVTMSEESSAAKGVVTVESNKVLPSADGKGYYENLKTVELLPGESTEVSIEDGQHIYTSINSIMEFVPQSS
ncbi:MAG: hypothetical protein Q4C00_07685, partial [Bacillota bacterium]|nr:hypothetical protein [Bacillota bacterium]